MKNNLKKLFTMLLVIGLVTGCGCNKKEDTNKTKDDVKVNTNEEVIKDQELEVFTFTNTSLVYENGTSTLETVVTNTSDQEQYLTEYDAYVQPRELQMLKAMLPFVHTKSQMPLAIMIQAMEFRSTIKYFRDNENTLTAFSLNNDIDKRSAMLQTLKKFCTPKERETLDTILNIMCVMENFDKEDSLGRFIT